MIEKKNLFLLLVVSVFLLALPVQSVSAASTTRTLVPGITIFDYRDITSLDPTPEPTASFDKTEYNIGDTAIVTITDFNGNLDPSMSDSISATYGLLEIILDETDINNGIFSGSFTINEPLELIYIPDLPESARATVTLDLASGTNVTLRDVPITDAVIPSLPFEPVIHALEVDLDDSGALTPGLPIIVTLSFANGAFTVDEIGFECTMEMFYKPPLSAIWEKVNVVTVDCGGPLLTYTSGPDAGLGAIPVTEGQFSLGFPKDLGGGGGGGISRAGLVVQAVGAVALFGGGGGTSGPPSFDSAVFSLETDGVKASSESLSTTSLTVGKKSDVSMGFTMPGGLNNLDHIGLYANIGSGQDKYDSDTYIYFDRFKTPQITIHDPHGFFKSVNIDVTEPTKSNIDVDFVFDFAKSLDNPNVVFEAWNIQRDGAIKEIPGLLKVDDPTKQEVTPEVTPETTETITPTAQERPPVPDWVKSNAAWWGKGEIDDNEFTNGIGYLIQNKIINVPGLLQKNTSPEKVVNPDTGVIEPEEEFTPIVPDWVKNNAIWWSDGQLTDDDFLVGIQYMLEKGIIQVRV